MSRRQSRERRSSGGMSRRHILLLISGGALGGIFATDAFSTTVADRLATASVSSDDTAWLGISYDDQTASSGTTISLLNLTNQYGQPLDTVKVTVLNSGQIDITNIKTPDSLDNGETAEVTAEISCDSTVTEAVEVEVSVSNSGLSTEALRSSDITCSVLDPYDCHDVWEMACDYNEGDNLKLDDGARDGSVCMDYSGDVTLEMQKASRIEGFTRMTAGNNVTIRMQDDSIVDGAGALKGCGHVDVQLQGTGDGTGSEIKGDLCIRAGGNGQVELQKGSIIGGDLKIDADADTQVDIQSGSSVEGTIDENWASGWTNDYCGT